MRIKVILVATVVAALAIGVVSSNAALQTSTSVNVNVSKPGKPGSVRMVLVNNDTAGLVPQRISKITISSRVARWYSKGAGVCKSTVPTNAAGTNNAAPISPACPRSSRIGKGKFTVNTGTVGQAIPADLGTISGDVTVYNYRPSGGKVVALLFEIKSDIPVPNAHQYQLAQISKKGTLEAEVPNTSDLPPSVQQFLVGRTTSLNKLDVTLKSPKVKRGKKPLFTLKNNKKLDFLVTLDRDNG
ncbi:MAG: hypothetical protein ACPGWS_07830 [Solirubrobacterales bacterium]